MGSCTVDQVVWRPCPRAHAASLRPLGGGSKPTSSREAGHVGPYVITSLYLDGPEHSPGKKVLLPSSPGEPGPAKPMASQGDGRGVGASGLAAPPCLPSTPSALGGLRQQKLQPGSVAALGPDGAAGAPASRASEPTPNPGTQRPPSRLNVHVHRGHTPLQMALLSLVTGPMPSLGPCPEGGEPSWPLPGSAPQWGLCRPQEQVMPETRSPPPEGQGARPSGSWEGEEPL